MFSTYRNNWQVLKRELALEAVKFETMPYEELLRPAEELSTTRVVEGAELLFSAEAFNVEPNGDIHFCVDADGLPTLLGMKPAYQFMKRKDGSVYY